MVLFDLVPFSLSYYQLSLSPNKDWNGNNICLKKKLERKKRKYRLSSCTTCPNMFSGTEMEIHIVWQLLFEVFISHFWNVPSAPHQMLWQGSSDTLHPLRDYQDVSSHVLWSRLQIWQLIPFNSSPILYRSISVTSLISLLTARDTPPASAAIPQGLILWFPVGWHSCH